MGWAESVCVNGIDGNLCVNGIDEIRGGCRERNGMGMAGIK
jgi:hypothetical protein